MLMLSLLLVESGSRHNPVRRSQLPVRSMELLWRMLTWLVSNVATQPASHNFPIEMSELLVSPGIRCAVFAVVGSWAMSSWQESFVDVRIAPFGNPMCMGFWLVPVLRCGSVVRK